VSAPPTSGPIATATPIGAPYRLIAMPRSRPAAALERNGVHVVAEPVA